MGAADGQRWEGAAGAHGGAVTRKGQKRFCDALLPAHHPPQTPAATTVVLRGLKYAGHVGDLSSLRGTHPSVVESLLSVSP